METIRKQERCFGRTLVFFTRRRQHQLRTYCVVLRREADRRSSLMLHYEPNQD